MTQDTLSYTTVATTSPFLLSLLTTPGSAALRIKNSELPSAIQVDETANHEVARRLGAGVQVYDCDPAKGTFTFREPQADLYDLDTAIQRGIHFVGPEPGTASTASPSLSMASGGCVSAPRPPAAPPPCCSAPGSTTRATGSWARSTPSSSPAGAPGPEGMTALVGQVPVTAISFQDLTEAPERREPAFSVAVPDDGRVTVPAAPAGWPQGWETHVTRYPADHVLGAQATASTTL